MLSKVVQDALNKQINNEFMASYAYLAMAVHCEHLHFTGAGKWLRVQSQEEYGHAMRLLNFLTARGGKVELKALTAPKNDYKSLLDVFDTAYRQEQSVSKAINTLYEVAFKERAFDTVVQTEWFVNEQVEEEQTMREIVAKLRMIKDDAPSLLDFDRELGGRTPAAADAPAE